MPGSSTAGFVISGADISGVPPARIVLVVEKEARAACCGRVIGRAARHNRATACRDNMLLSLQVLILHAEVVGGCSPPIQPDLKLTISDNVNQDVLTRGWTVIGHGDCAWSKMIEGATQLEVSSFCHPADVPCGFPLPGVMAIPLLPYPFPRGFIFNR